MLRRPRKEKTTTKKGLNAFRYFHYIAQPGACGKTGALSQNWRPNPGLMEGGRDD